MDEKINGRTPEEIKHVAEWNCYSCGGLECDDCSYLDACTVENRDRAVPDALALIERLESERDAALAKVSKWISVEERLPPPETERYLVVSIYPAGVRNVETAVWAWNENDGQGEWIKWGIVTHWMPLPEPPKEEEK